MKLAVISTGGKNLGYGHFMRSATFVKSAPEEIKVRLFPVADVGDDHLFNRVKDKTTISRNEEELYKNFIDYGPDIVVWDTVDFSDKFFNKIQECVSRSISISPVFRHMKDIDVLYTRNINTPDIEGVKICKGLEFAIFNDNCTHISDELYYSNLSKPYLTIGISMGGADAPNKTLKILEALADIKLPLTIWVLLGEGYVHSYEDLVSTSRNDGIHEIILAKSNRSLWHILSNCSMAILAGGLMTIEAVYAGLPSLNIFEKDEHRSAAGMEIFDRGAAESIGIFGDISMVQLQQRIQYYFENKSSILSMRENSKGLIDKRAVSRIYSHIISNKDS